MRSGRSPWDVEPAHERSWQSRSTVSGSRSRSAAPRQGAPAVLHRGAGRPAAASGLQEAVAAAVADRFDVLLVYRVDRFTRRWLRPGAQTMCEALLANYASMTGLPPSHPRRRSAGTTLQRPCKTEARTAQKAVRACPPSVGRRLQHTNRCATAATCSFRLPLARERRTQVLRSAGRPARPSTRPAMPGSLGHRWLPACSATQGGTCQRARPSPRAAGDAMPAAGPALVRRRGYPGGSADGADRGRHRAWHPTGPVSRLLRRFTCAGTSR